MKKLIIAGAAVIALAAGGFFLYNTSSSKDKSSASETGGKTEPTGNDSTRQSAGKKACEVLTLADAKTLIGDNATEIEGSGDPNLATTDKVSVDNCSYSADGATLGDMKQLILQVQSGDSASVKQAFENYKKEYPGDPLPEFGSTAYFGTETKQVHVLKDGTWFFVGGGSINNGDAANKELAIKAAQIAVKNL
jgi:hypothetical protein